MARAKMAKAKTKIYGGGNESPPTAPQYKILRRLPGYSLGDPIRQKDAMLCHSADATAFAMNKLRPGDCAFLLRSNGTFTYAIYEGHPHNGGHPSLTDSSSGGGENSLLSFKVDEGGLFKTVTKIKFCSRVKVPVLPRAFMGDKELARRYGFVDDDSDNENGNGEGGGGTKNGKYAQMDFDEAHFERFKQTVANLKGKKRNKKNNDSDDDEDAKHRLDPIEAELQARQACMSESQRLFGGSTHGDQPAEALSRVASVGSRMSRLGAGRLPSLTPESSWSTSDTSGMPRNVTLRRLDDAGNGDANGAPGGGANASWEVATPVHQSRSNQNDAPSQMVAATSEASLKLLKMHMKLTNQKPFQEANAPGRGYTLRRNNASVPTSLSQGVLPWGATWSVSDSHASEPDAGLEMPRNASWDAAHHATNDPSKLLKMHMRLTNRKNAEKRNETSEDDRVNAPLSRSLGDRTESQRLFEQDPTVDQLDSNQKLLRLHKKLANQKNGDGKDNAGEGDQAIVPLGPSLGDKTESERLFDQNPLASRRRDRGKSDGSSEVPPRPSLGDKTESERLFDQTPPASRRRDRSKGDSSSEVPLRPGLGDKTESERLFNQNPSASRRRDRSKSDGSSEDGLSDISESQPSIDRNNFAWVGKIPESEFRRVVDVSDSQRLFDDNGGEKEEAKNPPKAILDVKIAKNPPGAISDVEIQANTVHRAHAPLAPQDEGKSNILSVMLAKAKQKTPRRTPGQTANKQFDSKNIMSKMVTVGGGNLRTASMQDFQQTRLRAANPRMDSMQDFMQARRDLTPLNTVPETSNEEFAMAGSDSWPQMAAATTPDSKLLKLHMKATNQTASKLNRNHASVPSEMNAARQMLLKRRGNKDPPIPRSITQPGLGTEDSNGAPGNGASGRGEDKPNILSVMLAKAKQKTPRRTPDQTAKKHFDSKNIMSKMVTVGGGNLRTASMQDFQQTRLRAANPRVASMQDFMQEKRDSTPLNTVPETSNEEFAMAGSDSWPQMVAATTPDSKLLKLHMKATNQTASKLNQNHASVPAEMNAARQMLLKRRASRDPPIPRNITQPGLGTEDSNGAPGNGANVAWEAANGAAHATTGNPLLAMMAAHQKKNAPQGDAKFAYSVGDLVPKEHMPPSDAKEMKMSLLVSKLRVNDVAFVKRSGGRHYCYSKVTHKDMVSITFMVSDVGDTKTFDIFNAGRYVRILSEREMASLRQRAETDAGASPAAGKERTRRRGFEIDPPVPAKGAAALRRRASEDGMARRGTNALPRRRRRTTSCDDAASLPQAAGARCGSTPSVSGGAANSEGETLAPLPQVPSTSTNDTTISNAKEKGPTHPSILTYKAGMCVYYKEKEADDAIYSQILEVHLDDSLEPYYTIQLEDGRVKQTDSDHISMEEQ